MTGAVDLDCELVTTAEADLSDDGLHWDDKSSGYGSRYDESETSWSRLDSEDFEDDFTAEQAKQATAVVIPAEGWEERTVYGSEKYQSMAISPLPFTIWTPTEDDDPLLDDLVRRGQDDRWPIMHQTTVPRENGLSSACNGQCEPSSQFPGGDEDDNMDDIVKECNSAGCWKGFHAWFPVPSLQEQETLARREAHQKAVQAEERARAKCAKRKRLQQQFRKQQVLLSRLHCGFYQPLKPGMKRAGFANVQYF